MTGWRDDLPAIPSERIRTEAMREGSRRREVRAKRQRAVLYGGFGTAVCALIVLIAVQSDRSEQAGDDGDAASATTTPVTGAEAAEDTVVPATTEARVATEAPANTVADTTAAAATTAAAETTEAPTTEAPVTTEPPAYTTVPGTIATQPVSAAVMVTRTVIWEQPLTGNLACGPTTVDVEFRPQGFEVRTPLVHWEVAGVRGEAPMEVDGDTARATIGPFQADTLDPDTQHEVLVYVTDVERFGDEIFRAPLVILRGCSP